MLVKGASVINITDVYHILLFFNSVADKLHDATSKKRILRQQNIIFPAIDLSNYENQILNEKIDTAKPVYNDHLYDKFYYLWFIQQCVLMTTEDANLLVLTISAFWSSSRWPLAT